MIRKLGRFEASVPLVREMFCETDDWPRWMPGIASTRTLSRDSGTRRVEVVHMVHGRRFVQQLECRETERGLEHHQISGFFKTWEAAWTFRETPDGLATTVSLFLDLELGVGSGLLVPKRLLAAWVGRMLDDTIAQGQKRALQLVERRRQPTSAVQVGQPVLQVFETDGGFEVMFAGRRFVIDALPPTSES
ncbi:MAG: SRPBCC family protein [Acidobacteriota bacterium]